MLSPLTPPLIVTQLHLSLRGGPGEAYDVWHDGTLYHCDGHAGIDFAASIGTPVHAMKGGVLSVTPHDPWQGGYAAALGLYAVIALPSGETHTFAHLSQITAAPGTVVAPGAVFALSGATGNVQPPGNAGAHLHIGVRPPTPDYANHADGTISFLDHFDHDIVLDLSRV